MGKRNTFEGYLRAHGGRPRDTVPAAVVPVVLAIKGLDALLAGAGISTGKYMPVGAVVLSVAIKGAGTGGTTPLVDVGLEHGTPVDDALVNGVAVDADTFTGIGTASVAGAELGVVQTEQSLITVSDGGGTNATGGTFDLYITYTFDDDGVVND